MYSTGQGRIQAIWGPARTWGNQDSGPQVAWHRPEAVPAPQHSPWASTHPPPSGSPIPHVPTFPARVCLDTMLVPPTEKTVWDFSANSKKTDPSCLSFGVKTSIVDPQQARDSWCPP